MNPVEMKDKADDRLRRKLKLQEMRCNLMSIELDRLKELISKKENELSSLENKRKEEELKRKEEEKKRKNDLKELTKFKNESEQHMKTLKMYKKRLSSLENKLSRQTANTESSSTHNKVWSSTSKENEKNDNTSHPPPTSTEVSNVINASEDLNQPGPSGLNSGPTPSTESSEAVVNKSCPPSAFLPGGMSLYDYLEGDLMCSICHEHFISPVLLSCCHVFCKYCIFEWRKNNHNCPICRTFIYNVHADQTLSNIIDKVAVTMTDEAQKKRKMLITERSKYVINQQYGLEHDQMIHEDAMEARYHSSEDDDIDEDSGDDERYFGDNVEDEWWPPSRSSSSSSSVPSWLSDTMWQPQQTEFNFDDDDDDILDEDDIEGTDPEDGLSSEDETQINEDDQNVDEERIGSPPNTIPQNTTGGSLQRPTEEVSQRPHAINNGNDNSNDSSYDARSRRHRAYLHDNYSDHDRPYHHLNNYGYDYGSDMSLSQNSYETIDIMMEETDGSLSYDSEDFDSFESDFDD